MEGGGNETSSTFRIPPSDFRLFYAGSGRAQKKRKTMTKYALMIGEEFCWGCKTCEVACKQENGAADGVKLIAVWEDGPRSWPASSMSASGSPCAGTATSRPASMPARQRPSPNGRTVSSSWILRSAPAAAPAWRPALTMRSPSMRRRGSPRKCNLCHHRVDKGLIPACADNVCPGHCIHFDDPQAIGQQPMGLRD